MRILIAGAWQHPIYESASAAALQRLSHRVIPFEWGSRFRGRLGNLQLAVPASTAAVVALNREFLALAVRERPDAVLLWSATLIKPGTLARLRRCSSAVVVAYCNDDPYGTHLKGRTGLRHRLLWRWFLRGLPQVDLTLVYREVNVREALSLGARRVAVMMPYFVPDWDRPVELTEAERCKYACDVVFAGHFETDGRVELLRALVRGGLRVRLYGGRDWNRGVLGDLGPHFGTVRHVVGEDYRKALCAARVCLAVLSRRNRDVYTRRCFEIPACGRVLLAERTQALRALFKEDEEAVFFTGADELVRKARWLCTDPGAAERIAAAGRRRVIQDAHSVDDRMAELVERARQVAHDGGSGR